MDQHHTKLKVENSSNTQNQYQLRLRQVESVDISS